ncbi:MAG TPA: cytidylate kinase-like family protein [Candidatus Fimivicinus intestinavium]|nr:cytidylate kinase-like family protein [Candidatus Fimivicinus intestinavium]
MSEQNTAIITIGRQFGSGGREIGETLAKELGIPFYDKELIALAGQRSGIDQSLLDDVDENATNSMLYSLVAGSYTPPNGFAAFPEESMADRLFATQCKVVRELAEKGPCVLVGRCCDYILREDPRCLRVFIHAPVQERVKRIMRLYKLDEAKATALMKKTDKRRAAYYTYYTGWKWGLAETNQLSLDSASLGIAASVQLIRQFVELCEAR